MPILIINGANDPYWVIDAAQFYFNDLPSRRKYALYVPNGGHGLGDYERVLNSMVAFYKMAVGDLEFPHQVEGSATRENNRVRYRVRTDRSPERVQVWVARSNSLDFRPSRWEPVEASREGREWVATIELPQDANLALFAELTYRDGNQPYTLCTIPSVVGNK
jgi:PhoPQ-activated pathogenicity-related protein